MDKHDIKLSRRLSYILRHKPEEFDVCLSAEGWTGTLAVAKALKCTVEDIKRLVVTDDKGRYELRAHDTQVRAVQGHSSPQVRISYPVMTPPDILYHGTSTRNIDSILQNGINSASRNFVHLSEELVTAIAVGSRHGKPVVFAVDTKKVRARGCDFYLAPNGVWLCPLTIPPDCISIYTQK